MQSVASHRVRNLHVECSSIDADYLPEFPFPLNFPTEIIDVHSQALAGHLHHDFVRRRVAAGESRQPGHSLVTHGSDFDCTAVLHDRHCGNHAADREVDPIELASDRIKSLPKGKWDTFQKRLKSLPIRFRQTIKKTVARRE